MALFAPSSSSSSMSLQNLISTPAVPTPLTHATFETPANSTIETTTTTQGEVQSSKGAGEVRRRDVIIQILLLLSRLGVQQIEMIDLFIHYIFSDYYRYSSACYKIGTMFIDELILTKEEKDDYVHLHSMICFSRQQPENQQLRDRVAELIDFNAEAYQSLVGEFEDAISSAAREEGKSALVSFQIFQHLVPTSGKYTHILVIPPYANLPTTLTSKPSQLRNIFEYRKICEKRRVKRQENIQKLKLRKQQEQEQQGQPQEQSVLISQKPLVNSRRARNGKGVNGVNGVNDVNLPSSTVETTISSTSTPSISSSSSSTMKKRKNTSEDSSSSKKIRHETKANESILPFPILLDGKTLWSRANHADRKRIEKMYKSKKDVEGVRISIDRLKRLGDNIGAVMLQYYMNEQKVN